MAEAALTDAAVLARMRAAVAVLREAGLAVPEVADSADADAHLRRALHWHRYSRGSVSDLHRSCASDIARGSLRLWSLAGGVPVAVVPPRRAVGPLARVRLGALVRTKCAALRADLATEAAGLSRRGIGAFEERVRREVRRVALEVDAAADARLGELGLPPDPSPGLQVEDLLPPRRRPRLENQLTALLGAGFGTGISLTLGRLIADLRPDWMPVAAIGCGLLGLALTTWTVQVRRLLAERIAAERWMTEAVANLRPALEERVLTRLLVAELAVS